MKIIYLILSFAFIFGCTTLTGQQDSMMKMEKKPVVRGFHVGYVQPIWATTNGEGQWLDTYDRYSMGFPFGISFNTSGLVIIDLEFVPFIKPYFGDDTPAEIHLLYHPGILIPVGYGMTFGVRAAFELGVGQIGFTPLLNKSFDICKGTKGFLELVLPGRFGPEKDSGYTQIVGLHVGVAF